MVFAIFAVVLHLGKLLNLTTHTIDYTTGLSNFVLKIMDVLNQWQHMICANFLFCCNSCCNKNLLFAL